MKTKSMFAAFILVIILPLKSNSQGYAFSIRSEQYNDLSEAIVVNDGLWGNKVYTIPIGFDFLYFDSIINKLYVYENLSGLLVSENLENTKLINPFGATLIDRGIETSTTQSTISYKLINDPGNRICIIEWKNFGFEGDYWCYEQSNDYVNFQVWLYENNDVIEFHYGRSLITNFDCSLWGESGPTICLNPWVNLIDDIGSDSTIWVTGLPDSPSITLSEFAQYLNGMSIDGMVYSFSNLLSSVRQIDYLEVDACPNPVNNNVLIKIPELVGTCFIEVYDIQGKPCIQKNLNFNEGIIQVSLDNLTSGIKFINIKTQNKAYHSKIVKF